MNPEVLAALQPIAERLRATAKDNPQLAGWLRDLGQLLLALTEAEIAAVPEPVVVVAPPPEPVVVPVPVVPVPVVPVVVEPKRPEPPVIAVAEQFAEPSHGVGWYRSVFDEELPLIEQRCRIKADASRWAIKRRNLLKIGADFITEIEPNDQALIGRAKVLPDCFLWMCHRDSPTPEDLSLFEDLAGGFDTMADAVALLQALLANAQDADNFAQAIDLTAEAQSTVRAAILTINGPTDGDQQKVFSWLRSAAAERQLLIRRFMRRDDPADPAAWPSLRERIHQIEERLQRYKNRDRRSKSLFNKIRYHLKHFTEKPTPEERAYEWTKIVEAGDQLVTEEGLPPSNVELRDLLLPILDEIPDETELPEKFKLVLREIDRYLASRQTKADTETTPTASEEVRRVRKLLQGRTVVMIGGDRRPFSADALVASLGLKELVWIETREHQTHTVFESHVGRPDVVLVVLAIRWSSHSFGEVKDYCDKYNKPLVHLPVVYNPNQVAFHILNQVGERLRETA